MVTGLYLIQDPCSRNKVFNFAKMHVRCDMETDGGGWIIIQRRITNGTVNFYRNWEDYENGFGGLDGEFWIGLRNIYEFTNQQGVDLQISAWNENEARISWNYPLFRISGPEEGYRLTVGRVTGRRGLDAFANSNGFYFSTYDHDNYNSDCVTRFQAGWWYYDWGDCTYSNLNGPHEPSAGFRGIEWDSGWGRKSYTNTEMKIRSKTCGLSG